MVAFRKNNASPGNRPWGYLVSTLLLSNVLVYQWASSGRDDAQSFELLNLERTIKQQMQQSPSSGAFINNPLAIPRGEAQALPSIRVEDNAVDRQFYGGKGDKKHLGGFTDIDTQGISPRAWKWMINRLNIQSVLDVGCGRGISTTWFIMHGLRALCVEGSHDARQQTMLPDPDKQMVEHDFTRGPWWPGQTFDAVWCVEFLEHVGRNFHKNYLPAFRKAGLIFVTSSINGGWHHVEVHRGEWWRKKMEFYGFHYMKDLTQELRTLVWNETNDIANKGFAPNGKAIGAPHIHGNMQIFLNTMVSALPEHHHLYYEPGCFVSRGNGVLNLRDCGIGPGGEKETPLPPEYKPLKLTLEQDDEWFQWVKARVKPYTDNA